MYSKQPLDKRSCANETKITSEGGETAHVSTDQKPVEAEKSRNMKVADSTAEELEDSSKACKFKGLQLDVRVIGRYWHRQNNGAVAKCFPACMHIDGMQSASLGQCVKNVSLSKFKAVYAC